MARMCSSNWLAGQASIVQWPELCGRGAISLTSTRPSRSTNISTASSPTRSSASATRRAIACACRSTDSGMRAGASVRSRIWSRWRFSTVSNAAIGAVLAARGDHADLLGEVDETLQDQWLGRQGCERLVQIAGIAAASPDPCRRSRGAWSSGSRADRSARRRATQRIEVLDRRPGRRRARRCGSGRSSPGPGPG